MSDVFKFIIPDKEGFELNIKQFEKPSLSLEKCDPKKFFCSKSDDCIRKTFHKIKGDTSNDFSNKNDTCSFYKQNLVIKYQKEIKNSVKRAK